jgi:hypothetical protein
MYGIGIQCIIKIGVFNLEINYKSSHSKNGFKRNRKSTNTLNIITKILNLNFKL